MEPEGNGVKWCLGYFWWQLWIRDHVLEFRVVLFGRWSKTKLKR